VSTYERYYTVNRFFPINCVFITPSPSDFKKKVISKLEHSLKKYAQLNPMAMKAMVRDGFPATKIYYYRGGMLDWDALGLTSVKGEF
jgi:hypothetical protein